MDLIGPAHQTTRLSRRNPKDETKAKSQFKSGGPTRGRLRVRKMGMGSGKAVAQLKAKGNKK